MNKFIKINVNLSEYSDLGSVWYSFSNIVYLSRDFISIVFSQKKN